MMRVLDKSLHSGPQARVSGGNTAPSHSCAAKTPQSSQAENSSSNGEKECPDCLRLPAAAGRPGVREVMPILRRRGGSARPGRRRRPAPLASAPRIKLASANACWLLLPKPVACIDRNLRWANRFRSGELAATQHPSIHLLPGINEILSQLTDIGGRLDRPRKQLKLSSIHYIDLKTVLTANSPDCRCLAARKCRRIKAEPP